MRFKSGLIALAFAGSAFAQTQGVSKGELVIGTMQDLSGPIVAFSKQLKNGMRCASRSSTPSAGSTAASSSW